MKRDPRDAMLYFLGFLLVGILLTWPVHWLNERRDAALCPPRPRPVAEVVYVPMWVPVAASLPEQCDIARRQQWHEMMERNSGNGGWEVNPWNLIPTLH